MKLITYFMFFAASIASARAYKISCTTEPNQKSDYFVEAKLNGRIFVSDTADRRYQLNDYSFNYQVYMTETDGDATIYTEWGSGESLKGKYLWNDASYAPKKYTNHAKFELPARNGSIDLIVPEDLRLRTFRGVLVMTNIHDHFGASVKLNCLRYKIAD